MPVPDPPPADYVWPQPMLVFNSLQKRRIISGESASLGAEVVAKFHCCQRAWKLMDVQSSSTHRDWCQVHLNHAGKLMLVLLLLGRRPVAGPCREGVLPVHGGHVLPHQHAQPVAVVVPSVRLDLHMEDYAPPFLKAAHIGIAAS